MLNNFTKIILALGLQISIIFVIIMFKSSVISGGEEILLRINPADPRDVLRGDYVSLQYDISLVPHHYFISQQVKNGDVVYAFLRQSGKYWRVSRVQNNKPNGADLFIKGRVISGGIDSQISDIPNYVHNGPPLKIEYGIEQYFIPEGKGQTMNFMNKNVDAHVVVDKDGNSVLKQIYVDNKVWP